jgi:hypothetical protein
LIALRYLGQLSSLLRGLTDLLIRVTRIQFAACDQRVDVDEVVLTGIRESENLRHQIPFVPHLLEGELHVLDALRDELPLLRLGQELGARLDAAQEPVFLEQPRGERVVGEDRRFLSLGQTEIGGCLPHARSEFLARLVREGQAEHLRRQCPLVFRGDASFGDHGQVDDPRGHHRCLARARTGNDAARGRLVRDRVPLLDRRRSASHRLRDLDRSGVVGEFVRSDSVVAHLLAPSTRAAGAIAVAASPPSG